jgi:hypothetical protein
MRTWRIVATAAVLGFSTAAVDAGGWPGGDREVVVEWNEILERTAPAGGLSQPRYYAMLHIAMFDAVNSIERTYRPYVSRAYAWRGASPEVAAAQAARDVLAAQLPAATPTFDAALAARIARAHPHQAHSGMEIGKAVAAAVLAWRQDDGWSTPAPEFVRPELPGMYQRTPPSFASPAFAQFGRVTPFALLTSTQYLPDPPPALASEQYAEDFEEVKTLGSATSTARSAEQTQLAQLFAGVTSRTAHWAIWNHIARDMARVKRMSLVETARLYALLNVAIHDGLQTSHTSKFVYGSWRPITAIRAADDLHPATMSDPSWTPLLTTPPYPSHAGNMACVSASASRMLALLNGSDQFGFSAVWLGATGHPDVSRSYSSLQALAQDQADSRIYGGIHFRFESLVSQEACPKVAEYVYARFMRPKR